MEILEKSAIEVKNVSMMFNLSKDKVSGLKEYIVKSLKRQLFYEKFWALRDISFDVKRGEVFGIMGLNGAGKSTLLKLIAGVFKPTSGSITVRGEISPLLELGAGFDVEVSARENIYMNGAMYGHSKKYMAQKYDEIIDFAELWEFEDVALKNFSSGMVARLGFAVATSVKPDILIVDEILGVGDYKFMAKCIERIEGMISGGTTALMVTHDIELIKRMCSRAILLERGKVICGGDMKDVVAVYGDPGVCAGLEAGADDSQAKLS
ncbi:MAG: ABC transporter ATP-binding protein [Oscillospiraceae bacterium]|nr:ABC transporter ATP-binding protein [Oscillospiraceae bacterium]